MISLTWWWYHWHNAVWWWYHWHNAVWWWCYVWIEWINMCCQEMGLNTLWPNDTIWWYRHGSILAQVMACCLMAPGHSLNQWWLIITDNHVGEISEETPQPAVSEFVLTMTIWNFIQISRGEWVKQYTVCCWNLPDIGTRAFKLKSFVICFNSLAPGRFERNFS